LQDAQCFRTAAQLNRYSSGTNHPCETITKYEASKHIAWKGLKLSTTNPPLAKLSTFKTQYLEAIKAEIDEIFPEDRSGTSISDLDIFDHRLFNSLSDAEIKRKIKTAAKFIGYTNLPKLYVDEYLNLVKKIKQDPIELCEKSRSSPRLAWTVFIESGRYQISDFLRKVVLTATVIPFGTAEVERSFSHMNIIKDKRKARMEHRALEAQMRITINGPPFHAVNFNEYVVEYLNKKHHRCDALFRKGGPGFSPSLDQNDDERSIGRASTYSDIYVA